MTQQPRRSAADYQVAALMMRFDETITDIQFVECLEHCIITARQEGIHAALQHSGVDAADYVEISRKIQQQLSDGDIRALRKEREELDD